MLLQVSDCKATKVNEADDLLDLLAVLREQGSRRHGEVLEWIGESKLGFQAEPY